MNRTLDWGLIEPYTAILGMSFCPNTRRIDQ